MKKIILALISLFIGISCFGQGIEFYGSLNTSGEQRFQPGYGIGLQFQQNLSRRFIAGLGVSYHFSHTTFDQRPYMDADPNLIVYQHITSNSNRFAVRFNIQGLLIDHKNFSWTLGPALSYNILWGKDQIKQTSNQSSTPTEYSQKNGKVKDFGVGLISGAEFKNLIARQVSLCFSIRPELLLGNTAKLVGASALPFSGILGFTDFQIGIKYRFKR
jgi:hypothetical protein